MLTYIYLGKREEVTESNEILVLTYYMIEDSLNSRIPNMNLYGICIEKEIANKNVYEKEIARGLTYSKEYAEFITDMLMRNSVTPFVMLEVIDDLMSTMEEGLA